MILTIVAIGAIAYLSCCLFLIATQTKFIFFPSPIITTKPPDLDLIYEDVWLSVEGNQKIHGWWLPNRANSDVLLYLHGNGENIGGNLWQAKRLYQLGFTVLIVDYRGYGWSHGKFPSEKQVYADAQRAYDYLIEEKGIKARNIFIYGHSLGGAIAIELAVKNSQIAGLIVESSFTSIKDLVNLEKIYRLFPVDFILHQHFDSLSKINQLKVPLLLIHGTKDQTVPYSMSEILYQAATVPKKLLIVPDAKHDLGDVAKVAGEQYQQIWRDFHDLASNLSAASQVRLKTDII